MPPWTRFSVDRRPEEARAYGPPPTVGPTKGDDDWGMGLRGYIVSQKLRARLVGGWMDRPGWPTCGSKQLRRLAVSSRTPCFFFFTQK